MMNIWEPGNITQEIKERKKEFNEFNQLYSDKV